MTDSIALVIPSYGHFNYVLRAVESFVRHTPLGVAVVVDDASPDWSDEVVADLLRAAPGRLVLRRFPVNGGVTRSWNFGLLVARALGVRWAVAGNSDVVLTPGWHEPLVEACRSGWSLVGPCTNAPGANNGNRQDVGLYDPDYRLSDDDRRLAEQAARLRASHGGQVVPATVNGFFQFASVEDWWSAGPTPFSTDPRHKMVGSEDELQARWRKLGRRSGCVPASFVLHYRSVSRPPKYRKGRWLRMAAR